MTTDTQQTLLKKGLYTAWAFVTLILVFTLILLVIELAQSNDDISDAELATMSRPSSPVGGVPDHQAPEILLYFTHTDMVLLVAEPRRLELTGSTVENCKLALEALIQGPIRQLVPVMPSAARVRGIFLLDNGELVVDFSRELEAGLIKSTSTEWLWVQSVAHTLTQDALVGSDGKHIRSVRFLFEGAPAQSSFPQHLDATDPVLPAPSATSSAVESLGNA
jgi:Sporulation and spore germination